jgi:hypothetical protein
VTPESLEDFVDLVVPILQECGAYKRDYLPGTLREKLFGRSRLLSPGHPVGAYRRPAHLQQEIQLKFDEQILPGSGFPAEPLARSGKRLSCSR